MSARARSSKEGFSGMKLPPLIKQLRRILDQYPDDGQILKELIQNAEDADATVVEILYNGRATSRHPSLEIGSLLDDIPHLRALQAPGLCVYNDGVFTEDDWDGITMVQSSVKEQEPLKVGRFGLGFKSVFHLTDVPLVISGKHILLIDPHEFERNHEKVCLTRNLDNIADFKEALLSVLEGTFGFSEKTIEEGYFEGTLFWFPMRREETELSDNVYGDEKIQDLFQAFRAEAPHMMLFLKSLTTVHLFQRNADLFGRHCERDRSDILFSVDISSGNTEHISIPRKDFASSIRELKGKLPAQAIEKRYHLTVATQDYMTNDPPKKETTTWIVVQHHTGGKISKAFRKLCFDKEISSCPCVGLAVALEDHQRGHIFCFLPLPLEVRSPTGLPVHVHGHFALSQNRRHVKWPTADQKTNRAQTDKAIRWNQHLLSDVFPQAYISLVNELISHWKRNGQSESSFQRIYQALPVVSDVTEHWQVLTEEFYKLLFKEPFLYTPSLGGKLVGLTEAHLLDASNLCEINDTLVHTAVLCKNNLVPLPGHVCDAVQLYYSKTQTPRFVNPDSVCKMLRSSNVYTQLTDKEKLNLLEYVCQSNNTQCLEGVTLLPIADGSFHSFEDGSSVYLCEREDVSMFPGLKNRFVLMGAPTDKYLRTMAGKETFGIRELNPTLFVTLFKTAMETSFPTRTALISEVSEFNMEWLTRVWRYITDHDIDVKTDLFDISLIPGDVHRDGSAILHPVSSTFLCMNIDTVGNLNDALGSGLRHLGVVTLRAIPTALVKNTSILGDVIKYPSLVGVMKVLEETKQKATYIEKAHAFNTLATSDEKTSLVNFIGSCQNMNSDAKQLLRSLNIFSTTETSTSELNISLEKLCRLEPREHVPVCYPAAYIRGTSEECVALAVMLGADHVTQHEVIVDILKLMKGGDKRYKRQDVETFMIYLLEHTEFFKSETILMHARNIKFLTTENNENILYKANQLFEPHADLTVLFEGEDRIPAHKYLASRLTEGLQMLGLKRTCDVTEKDLCEIGNVTETILDNGEWDRARRKGHALVKYLKVHIENLKIKSLNELRYTKFIPCQVVKPENYPTSLKLVGEESSGLVSMQVDKSPNAWNSKYQYIIGAVAPVANDLSENVMKAFNLESEPPLEKVLDHLEITLASYNTKYDCDEDYTYVTKKIYKYLAQVKTNSMSGPCREKLSSMEFIWISPEWGFQGIKDIWINESKRDIDITPYRFHLPKLLVNIKNLVSNLGSVQHQTSQMLVDVVKEVQEKHRQAKSQSTNLSDDVHEDLRIVIHIINTLKMLKPIPDDMLLPIQEEHVSTVLNLKLISECTYCNVDMSLDNDIDGETEDDNIYIVHSDISEDTARKLGVPFLTDRILDGAEGIDFKFGQKESLTKRLHNILKGYSSMSVPKEIIQNAEDARASKVMFLYDERQNQDLRISLIDTKMATLQGPALWAFNDSRFTETDFKNIQDLGGATKQDDETKLGRFGLGFNSVYNLTDVPSFLSGNIAVFLDPHQTYLGNRRLGLKVDLSSSRGRRMLQTMKNQFEPFEGIFGCQLDVEDGKEICEGTLFRLPLRTEEQASGSQIKDQYFTRSDMQMYLNDLAKTAGNLIQFTQNIKCVEIYHLSNSAPIDKVQLLMSVVKDTEEQCIVSKGSVDVLSPQVNMISFFADKWKELRHSSYDEAYTIEKANVYLKNTKRFQSLFGVTPSNVHMRWQVTWTMGGDQSRQFAKSASVKGLIPLVSTAIPLTTCGKNNDITTVRDLSTCPRGFYNDGHLYCVLPLPLPPTGFVMHISAPFALTDDRQHLCSLSEDDMHSVSGRWNEVLHQDAVGAAIVTTLEGVKEALAGDTSAYYKLWPLVRGDGTQLSTNIDVVRNFYDVICRGKHEVFPEGSSGKYAAFNDAIFLSPELAYNKDVGKSAMRICEIFWTEDVIIDLPEEIFESFKTSSGDDLQSRVMDTEMFFEMVFSRNIRSASMDIQDRNLLTRFALKLSRPKIDNIVEAIKCIPCQPNGSMKSPGQLVHPHGKVAKMFYDADEVFPSSNFSEDFFLNRLCNLGMMRNELPWEMMVDRLNTIEIIHAKDRRAANRRCLSILQYLNQNIPETPGLRRFHKCPKEVMKQFLSIEFLPILSMPADWPFTWNTLDTDMLATPHALIFKDAMDLVGSSHKILDSYSLEVLHAEKDVLTWLGVRGKAEISVELVQHHLLSISQQISNGVVVDKVSTRIINNIYFHLDDFCRHDTCKAGRHLLEALQNHPVILHDKQLIFPNQAAFHLKFNLEPCLFQISPSMAHLYKELFIALGVQDQFTGIRLKEEVDKLFAIFQDKCMSDREVELYVHMVTLLADISTDAPNCHTIMLPDGNNRLCIASDLCIDDCNWIKINSKLKYVHRTISNQVALAFGVKTKIHANIETIAKPLFVSEFGQTEKLTDRIKGLLGGYPRDSSIMKELLQNADDAGATELRFIKDFRDHPTERVFGDKWKLLQGPALCVWNNSSFNEKDFLGIQALGVGSKSDDPLKTGQYGVGFNAVYHLTDVPSFLTYGPDTPETLCVLDPNIRYVPWATVASPGCKFEGSDELQNNFPDVYGCYRYDALDIEETGTLFRLPLRTKAMAEISNISAEDVPIAGDGGIVSLLKEFEQEATDALLFLQNVREIVIQSVKENGQIATEFSVVAKTSENDERKRHNYTSRLPKGIASTTAATVLETTLVLEVSDNYGKEEKWFVVHRCGFEDMGSVPEILKDCMNDGRIGMLPRGGVAVPLHGRERRFKGKVFCMLPLRIETGLPMHINGHFALDHEVRGNLWHGPHLYRTLWNKSIIENVIIPAFTTALCASRIDDGTLTYEHALTFLHAYSQQFPVITECTDAYWKLLSKSFYQYILTNIKAVFPVVLPAEGQFPRVSTTPKRNLPVMINWMPLSSSKKPIYFHSVDSAIPTCLGENANLVEILKDCGMHTVDMSHEIVEQFKASGLEDQIACTSPAIVIQFLKSTNNKCKAIHLPRDLTKTPLKDTTALIMVTVYCQQDPGFPKALNDLPLLLTQDRQLSIFNAECPIIVTGVEELVCGSPELVMHTSMFNQYRNIVDETNVLRRLEINIFSELLPYTMGHLHSNDPLLWGQRKSPSKQWIRKAWQFLHGEIMRSSIGKHADVDGIKEMLKPLDQWCLLPGRRRLGTETELKLYPVKSADNIFNLYQFKIYERFIPAFLNIAVPELDVETFAVERSYADMDSFHFAHALVVSLSNPIVVLKSVAHIFSTGVKINGETGKTLLHYFCSHLSTITEHKSTAITTTLRGLGIFEDISKNLRNIQGNKVYGISEFDSIPVEGMQTWSSQRDMMLLKSYGEVEDMLIFLGIQILSPVDLYEKFILKAFNMLPRDAQVVHLRHINDRLLCTYLSEIPAKKLRDCLKTLPFIVAKDGSTHMACEYFSKKEPLFNSFLSNDNFPSHPFDNPEWESFLEICGLVTSVSQEKFVEFARQVEKSDSRSIDIETKKKSNLLVQHLFQSRDDLLKGQFLPSIRNIKFVLPFESSNRQQEIMLREIHPQVQPGQLICYSGSTIDINLDTMWSVSCILHRKVSPDCFKYHMRSSRDRHQIASSLCIQREPTIDKVVDHIQNISKSLEEKDPKALNEQPLHDVILKVMTSIYTFLHNNVPGEKTETLSEMRCVFLSEEGIFVRPKDIVLDMSKDEGVAEYLYRAPIHFGNFFELFEMLGASKTVSANHYATILEVMSRNTKDTKLEPNELHTVQKVTIFLFKCLKKDEQKELSVKNLFLLNEDKKLADSRQLVIADSEILKTRLSSLNLEYFVGFRKLGIYIMDELEAFNMLPIRYRPKVLTTMTCEKLHSSCRKDEQQGRLALKYRNHIANKLFLDGLIRLINDERRRENRRALENDELLDIERKLAGLVVKEVKKLSTILSLVVNGQEIEKSIEEVTCFLDEANTPLTVYIHSTKTNSFANKILHNWLALAINKLTGFHLHSSLNTLESILDCTVDDIKSFLDSMKIRESGYICRHFDNTVFPSLGSTIHEEFHWMLDNSFYIFDEEEYVGYEKYDPLNDDAKTYGSLSRDEAQPEYIYAKVKKIVDGAVMAIHARYLIDVGEEDLKEVCGLDLYKFIRIMQPAKSKPPASDERALVLSTSVTDDRSGNHNQSHDSQQRGEPQGYHTPLDMDSVLKEIREILKEAWKLPEQKQRDKVKKRLLFKWHPDKNKDNTEFCTKVFQRIQNYISMLEQGENIDEDTGSDTRSKSTSSNSWFYEEMNRRSRRHQRDFENHYEHHSEYDFFGSRSSSFHRSARSEPRPQPQEARRWLRQAMDDMRVAKNTLKTGTGHNWCCFQCYMVCEKAVKGLLYNRDSKEADAYREANLRSVASKLDNAEIQDLADQMGVIVKDKDHAQYPTRSDCRAPCDKFTQDQAKDACRIAGDLLETAVGVTGFDFV